MPTWHVATAVKGSVEHADFGHLEFDFPEGEIATKDRLENAALDHLFRHIGALREDDRGGYTYVPTLVTLVSDDPPVADDASDAPPAKSAKREEWVAFAAAHGVEHAENATKAEIQTAVDNHEAAAASGQEA